jgi:hypothetical protein
MALKNLMNYLMGIRGPRTVLEQLDFEGFVELQKVSFPEDELECILYGRGVERALYNPEQDKIVSRYRHESTNQRREMSQV